MGEVIKLIAAVVNEFHDLLQEFSKGLGFELSDKDLHFWIIGIIGIFCFLFVQITFRLLSEYSITVISFIYTFTVLLVIVFAIEIQQKITGRGNMEFVDAIVGLYGFMAFFGGYILIRLIFYFLFKGINKNKKRSEYRNL
ncbi:hypothetical protein [Alkalihalobacillus sp. AL-G]|uniref:hypothetical protein n=1 Tax=Alkalihalobacillus sp. AL-G TaxID=2926399 RepID=UPI00272BA1E1|nr:hypothetical protein [Alkalihalobacillus sp. AL-G]WLD93004.1 hypothetical protein MOJ78_18690 [Alkalihalobacillus sp. AL-G]